MINFIRRLFGLSGPDDDVSDSHLVVARNTAMSDGTSSRSDGRSDGNRGRKSVATSYFDKMNRMKDAVSKRDYCSAAKLARQSLKDIPGFIEESRHEDGSLHVYSIPALEVGGTMLILEGDDDGVEELVALVRDLPELERWSNVIAQHKADRQLIPAILKAVQDNPGCKQTSIKQLIGVDDGRRISTLISWLEKAGKIKREREGKSYALWSSESPGAPEEHERRHVGSHRVDKRRPALQEIDIAQTPYVPLPRSPLRWEEAQKREGMAQVSPLKDYFGIRDTNTWEVVRVEKIPQAERPDPAFRLINPISTGVLMVDDLGNAADLGTVPAAAQHYSRYGAILEKKPLLHDTYRIEVNPLGRALIALSKECVVHAYSDALDPILETALQGSPEIQAACRRLNISDDQLKNHVRCVAISTDYSRYLVTIVDEAWCVSLDGIGIWGAKIPMKESWSRIASPSRGHGTTAEITRALSLMGLSYPIASDDIKKKYRQLAKKWHPDLNSGDPGATEKMQALTAAVELLSGIDEQALPEYTGVRYERMVSSHKINVGGHQVSMQAFEVATEKQAADWIYAACFAGRSNSVYLAGYSGRVILLSESGEPQRVYDIGSVPRRIVDTGVYLYILTDTRLYVLQKDVLHAIVDTFDGGELFVAQTGFGLLEKNRFRWFKENGVHVGSIHSKDPIRRVYPTDDGTVVETRTRRVIVSGTDLWWSSEQ